MRSHLLSGLLWMLGAITVCATAACSSTPSRTPAERAADSQLAERVDAALSEDPDIYARHIDVTVNRGVVHLGGYVWENREFMIAQRDAASVPGVKAVNSQMQLMRGGTTGTSR